ncbi:hypothetical protein AB4212_67360, partial [Streptomyces sp. 2MCAF27]
GWTIDSNGLAITTFLARFRTHSARIPPAFPALFAPAPSRAVTRTPRDQAVSRFVEPVVRASQERPGSIHAWLRSAEAMRRGPLR